MLHLRRATGRRPLHPRRPGRGPDVHAAPWTRARGGAGDRLGGDRLPRRLRGRRSRPRRGRARPHGRRDPPPARGRRAVRRRRVAARRGRPQAPRRHGALPAGGELLALARQTWIAPKTGSKLSRRSRSAFRSSARIAVDPLLELVRRVVLGVEVAARERVEAAGRELEDEAAAPARAASTACRLRRRRSCPS